MLDHTNQGIYNRILNLWQGSGASPDLIALMQLSLGINDGILNEQAVSIWVGLPGLCCQASGGHPQWADDLSVAWLLFYSAAHLMDRVQDHDEPDDWWRERGAGAALSAATGLFFSASLALNQLYKNHSSQAAAAEITESFHRSFLWMASGQYRDIGGSPETLDDYWERARAKSGSFFSLACSTGARLATRDADQLSAFERFGSHLGLLIQVKDDLDDIQPPGEPGVAGQRPVLAGSLPAVYALEVSQGDDRRRFLELLKSAPVDAQAARQVLSLIDQSGASIYVLAEIERHHLEGIRALESAIPPSPAREQISDLLNGLAASFQ